MTLDLTILQLAGFFEWFGGLFDTSGDAGGLPIVTNIVPWMMAGVLVLIAVFYWRYNTNMRMYPNPESRAGKLTILWQGQYEFKGNLSRLKTPISQKIFDELYQEEEYVEGIKELEKLVDAKSLFLYEMNITEWNDALNIKAKESALIISPVDIISDKYSWEDTKEKLSITMLAYEQQRYLMTSEESQVFSVNTLDETQRDVFVLAPIPRYAEKVGETLAIEKLDKSFNKDATGINIVVLPNMDKLAELIPKMVGMAKAKGMIRQRNINISNLNNVIKERDDKVTELSDELSASRAVASVQPLIGEVNQQQPEKPPSPYLWFALFGGAGFGGTKIPEMAPELAGIDPFLGGILAMVAMAGIYHFFGKPKEQTSAVVD